jgi:hypothetical protein
MTDTPVPKQMTTMRMRADVMAAITAEAQERGWSRTQLVEQVLLRFLVENGRVLPVRLVL